MGDSPMRTWAQTVRVFKFKPTGWKPVLRQTHGQDARATQSHGRVARATQTKQSDLKAGKNAFSVLKNAGNIQSSAWGFGQNRCE